MVLFRPQLYLSKRLNLFLFVSNHLIEFPVTNALLRPYVLLSVSQFRFPSRVAALSARLSICSNPFIITSSFTCLGTGKYCSVPWGDNVFLISYVFLLQYFLVHHLKQHFFSPLSIFLFILSLFVQDFFFSSRSICLI